MPPSNQFSCLNCSQRKVKCDKLSPCSSCSKTNAKCVYRPPPPSQRHRKRLTHGDLLCKIRELESLLTNHNVSYEPLDNSWIQSSWETKLEPVRSSGAQPNPDSAGTTIATQAQLATHGQETIGVDLVAEKHHEASRLWSDLTEDLKVPQISQLRQPIKDGEEQATIIDTALPLSFSLIPNNVNTQNRRLELHPEPKHVVQLWQTFVDNVNPLTKIVHTPTLQKKIFEAAWSVKAANPSLEATIFAVYALAAASMKPGDCLHAFGESKATLVARYRMGAMRALSDADLLATRDLEALQALALVLMIDPQSELSTTAVALAMRIAHKMGLHRAGQDTRVPFFEQEMQVRLWWYIRGLDSRTRRAMGLLATVDDLGDVRLPMNVNDADLHPNMTKPPTVQHTTATEMVFCLMKYDLWHFVRKSSHFSGSLNPREKASQLASSTDAEAVTKKQLVLKEVGGMLKEKYVNHLDTSIPLHRLSAALANITTHTQKFTMFHPRNQPDGGKHMSQADQDLVFESSVRLLELDYEVRDTSFSTLLIDHMACRTQVEALVYMVSELRQRTSGSLVDIAWGLLARMHEEQSEVMQGNHRFYTALADLTLKSWEARWQMLGLQAEIVPTFIEILQAARGNSGAERSSMADSKDPHFGFMGDIMHDETLDWTYWNDLLQL